MKNILITGGTGLVGTHLTQLLQSNGFEVAHLSRSHSKNETVKTFLWDIKHQTMDAEALFWADAVVHLAGAGVADKRWTENRKREILESRTHSTALLRSTLEKSGATISAFVSASAIGYYGFTTSSHIFKESDSPGEGFLAEVVKQWEQEIHAFEALSVRTVINRIGIVLAREGGALKEMSRPPVLAPLGSGNQWLAWIHIRDLCRIFMQSLTQLDMQGVFNAAGNSPSTNTSFTKALAKHSGKLFIPVGAPAPVMKLVMGSMAVMVLEGSRMSSEKLEKTGFNYEFDNLDKALEALF